MTSGPLVGILFEGPRIVPHVYNMYTANKLADKFLLYKLLGTIGKFLNYSSKALFFTTVQSVNS